MSQVIWAEQVRTECVSIYIHRPCLAAWLLGNNICLFYTLQQLTMRACVDEIDLLHAEGVMSSWRASRRVDSITEYIAGMA